MSQEFSLLLLIILLPFVTGLLSFLASNSAKYIAIIGSIITLIVTLYFGCTYLGSGKSFSEGYLWIDTIGATFDLSVGGNNFVLLLLTALIFPLIFLTTASSNIKNEAQFYGLMMLSMSGLMGVFLADDLLLFYFFWELALIPVYFLASMWGSDKRARVAFKFFIYTFLGSLLMLGGIIFLYLNSPLRSFQYDAILTAAEGLDTHIQLILFALFFIAFAIKMPVFPLHSWQPDAYQHTFTPVTVVLSAIMVKMGLYAAIKWLMPIFPAVVEQAKPIIIVLALISIVYGSLLALVQANIKRMLAYSSIAHIGLMALVIFLYNKDGLEAATLQMFNHGVNIAGMWLVVFLLEEYYGTQEMNAMGKLGQLSPVLSILLVIFSLASIGLPLTNGFVGEFLLFNNIVQSGHTVYMIIAGLSIILGAIYMLNMIQKVVYMQTAVSMDKRLAINTATMFSFIVIGIIIFLLGVYPKLIMEYIYFN